MTEQKIKKQKVSTEKCRKTSSFILGVLTVVLIPTIIYFIFNALSKNIMTGATISNVKPKITKAITPTIALDPNIKQVDCTFDKAKCDLINAIVSIVSTKNIDALVSYQDKTKTTCKNSSEYYQYVCDGAKNGEVKTGYTIGYYQGEGEFVLESNYKSELARRLAQGGYEYYGSIENQNKVGIVFTSPDQQGFFMLPLRKTTEYWTMSYLLMGFPDKNVYDLDTSLLNYIR